MHPSTKQTAVSSPEMMSGRMQPALHRAMAFLKENLAKQVWKPGERLPSSIQLSRSAGVSPVTLLKAIGILRGEGLVNGVRRGRLRAGGAIATNTGSSTSKLLGWEAKRVQLEKDILAGTFAHTGILPSFKELEFRYGVCFRTMRKVLTAMVDDGALTVRRKRYELRGVAAGRASRRIVFITNRVLVTPVSALNKGQYRIPELFEQECIRRGFQPDIVEIDFFNPVEARSALTCHQINRPAAGYILDTWWYAEPVFRHSYFDLLTRLSSLKKPVTILDETNEFSLPAPYSSNPLFQVFRIESSRAGAKIARILLGAGHRSVAFISSSHGQPYSQQRLQGIVDQFSKAGCLNVLPVVTDRVENPLENLLAIAEFDDKLVRRVLSVERTRDQAEGTFARFKRLRERAEPYPIAAGDVRILRKNLSGIIDLARGNVDGNFFNKMCLAFLAQAGSLMVEMSLRPLFEQAIRHKEARAWVCVSDGIALAALEYLHAREIAVPEKISVTGFDNEPGRALNYRLTTYDFNASGFIHAMLDFIARPPLIRGHYQHTAVEVEGTAMARETAGKVPA